MSELKDLAWSVQEQVEPTPFDTIHQKGTRRRHRKQLFAAAGAAAATAAAIVAVTLPTSVPKGDNAPPPIITQPTQPAADAPGERIIHSPKAELQNVHFATPDTWMATWGVCDPGPCQYAARLFRKDVAVATRVADGEFTPIQDGNNVYAVRGPEDSPLRANDPTWSKSLLARLTAKGLEERPLRFAAATTTFAPDEILTGLDPLAGLTVLNPRNATLRILITPAEFGRTSSPVRGANGRWWIVGGPDADGDPSYVAWTDDGGRNWQKHQIDDDNRARLVAVSHDGRTIIASSWKDGATVEAIGNMVLSADAGKTWRPVKGLPFARLAGPVAFDDGSGVLVAVGGELNDPPTAYQIGKDGTARKLKGWPKLSEGLAGDGKLLYGKTGPTSVAISNNRGVDWQTMTPR